MEEQKQPGRFENAPEDFQNEWLDHLAETSPFPGFMPVGEEKEALRKKMLREIKHRTGHAAFRISGRVIRWSAAAAILLLTAGIGYFKVREMGDKPVQYVTLFTQTGERKLIQLPDSSTVWLGPASGISYADNFSGNRQVKLLFGEALFDVSKDDDHPFSVGVDSLNVEVLGTSFNIKAYKKHEAITIGVSTGKIRVSKQSQVLSYLVDKEQISIRKQDYSFNKTTMPALDVEGLRNNRINFEDMPLKDVLTMLESYYPVTFEMADDVKMRISGSFSLKLQTKQVVKVLQQLVEKKIEILEKQPGIYTVRSSINKH
ncbi:ferric-dicitrate binding protein FerR (iron transport regulator) [Chitinophaga terrae (ex Kim and Jung 2007)]|uniref:FecR family protein n=1 Tax=Chitinophaga terrae (ex Kim and Jung 2007) TaxID=408074 RepID=UPI0027853913|nr:FecR domain-containing protein [Chitinophaga terrae (ex Kim and Jung 2007)]MDQ0109947.1 ferric-dicitrate binding protein FerR (iron transport regulator) [Chitinophaga terrae (ex Kim and Jung 2007)]